MFKYLLMILIAVSFYSCENKIIPEAVSINQMEMLSLLPADTDFLVYMNLENLSSSGLWNKYFKESIDDYSRQDWLIEFETRTKVGLKNGISDLFIASGWNQNNTFAVRFTKNYEQISDYFETEFKKSDYMGKKIYRLKDNSTARFYFPNDSLLVIYKNEEVLNKIISGREHRLINRQNFLQIIESITVKDQYWIATDQNSYALAFFHALFSEGEEIQAQKLIKLISNISLSADFSGGVAIYSNWNCKTEDDASQFSTSVRSAIALNLIGNTEYGLAEILDKVDISKKTKGVFINIKLTDNEISRLREVLKKNNHLKNL